MNLHDALNQLCLSYPLASFWIDAISINQKNNLERSEQVNITRHVYQTADKVIIWLGVSNDRSCEVKDQIEGLVEEYIDYVEI